MILQLQIYLDNFLIGSSPVNKTFSHHTNYVTSFQPYDVNHKYNKLRFIQKHEDDSLSKLLRSNVDTNLSTDQIDHNNQMYATSFNKRGLLHQGKLQNLYAEPINQSETDVFKMKSRIRSNNPNYIVGKSMVELRQTSRQHQYPKQPQHQAINRTNKNYRQLNARSQSFRVNDVTGLNSRNILLNQLKQSGHTGGEEGKVEPLVSFADMELVSKEQEKLHQHSHADSYLPIIQGDLNLSRHHLGTFYTTYSSKLQNKKKSHTEGAFRQTEDQNNISQYEELQQRSIIKYGESKYHSNIIDPQHPLIGFQDQLDMDISVDEAKVDFQKTQTLSFRKRNEDKKQQTQDHREVYNFKNQPSKKHLNKHQEKSLQPKHIYGNATNLNKIYIDKYQASQISTDRSKMFDSKKVSTMKMESRTSDISMKLQNLSKINPNRDKAIGDINITVYKDLFSQRSQPINDKLDSSISPNAWYPFNMYSNIENSQAYETSNQVLLSQNQHHQAKNNKILQDSSRLFNNQSYLTSHQISQMQPISNETQDRSQKELPTTLSIQHAHLIQKNNQIISNKDQHISSKGSQRSIMVNKKHSAKTDGAMFDLAQYKNKVFHSLSQAITTNEEQKYDLVESLNQIPQPVQCLEESQKQLIKQNNDEQISQAYRFSQLPNTYMVNSGDNQASSFKYQTRQNKQNSCQNTKANLNKSLVDARKNRSQKSFQFNKSAGTGNGLEKQLRSWLYGHYHIQLQNQIKQQRDIPAYGEIGGMLNRPAPIQHIHSQYQFQSKLKHDTSELDQLNQSQYFKIRNLNNLDEGGSNQLISQKDKFKIEEMRRKSNVDQRQPFLINLTTSPPQGKIQNYASREDQQNMSANMVSISSDNLNKINQRLSKENDMIQTLDGNLYLQNGFQIFDNSQLGASSITPTIHVNFNQSAEKLQTYQIYAKEQNLESHQNIIKLNNQNQVVTNISPEKPVNLQRDILNQATKQQQWQSPYQKHKISTRRINIAQLNDNSLQLISSRGSNEQNTNETTAIADHQAMIQQTIRANCQKMNLKKKIYKSQMIKMQIKAEKNEPEKGTNQLMSYVKYDTNSKHTEHEDKSLQMTQSPIKSYSIVKVGLPEQQKNATQNNSNVNNFNPIPLAQKIYLGSADKADRKAYSSLSNSRAPSQNQFQQHQHFASILPLMDKLDINISIQDDDDNERTDQQFMTHNIDVQPERSNTAMSDLSILVPINQRPSRSILSSDKKQKTNASIKKNRLSLNATQQMMPPKPPSRKETNRIDNEAIQIAQQEHIQALRAKIADLQSKKGTELKNGIQKDEHFYSNLTDLTNQELKTYLINQIYDIRETRKSFFESSQKIKQLLHDLQTGKDYSQLREKLVNMIESRYTQMNFELLYIETKRDLERLNLQQAHLKHKTEQLQQLAFGNANMSKEYKLKLQRQTDINSKQQKTILTQNKINSEKSLKVESLLQSVFTLTQEEEVLKTSKFKEEIVLKRTINFLLRENFELKKHCRIKDSFLESAQSEINRLKTKVNRLMLKIEEDNNINRNVNNNVGSNIANSSHTQSGFKKKFGNTIGGGQKFVNVQSAASRIQNDIAHILQSQKIFIDGQVQSNLRAPSPGQIIGNSPKGNNMLNNQLLLGQNSSHKSNQNSAGSMFDFEILSTGNAFHGTIEAAAGDIQKPTSRLLSHFQDDDLNGARVLSRMIIDNFDLDYRIKLMMDNREQDMNEELVDGSKQKFIEVTMSCQPLIHKERVDFLAKNYLSFKRLGERLNSIVKIILQNLKNVSIYKFITRIREELPNILQCQRCTLWAKDPTLNELYTYIDNNKEIRMGSVDDIVGYVLNNQQDLITADLQKYIQYYQTISSFSVEEKFFGNTARKSAILLPVKDYDTGMPLGVLEIVNSNSGLFDLDCQYMAFMISDFAGFVINSLNNEIRRRKAEHSRTLLNQYAVKIFSQNKLSDLNKISCEAIKEMLSTDKVKFSFIQESLVELNDYEIIAFSQNYDQNNIDEEKYMPEKKDQTYTKFRTKNYFGIMGNVMQTQQPTIIWNPKNDDRYNELIDMKTENPMYCFPMLDSNKVTSERRVVGCVQFENLQLRLLKGTQTIQQQQNSTNSSLLIDEHMKALMKEFSSYIAEVLKIIRNQKLLKKFKSFILKAQEHEHDHEHDNMLTNGGLSNQVSRQESNASYASPSKEEEELNFRIRNQAKIQEIKIDTSKVNKQFNINIHKEVMMSARLMDKKDAGDSSNKHSNAPMPLQMQLAPQNQLTIKKNVGFSLLKQMTKVSQQKTKEQTGMHAYERKSSAVKKQISPDRTSQRSNMRMNENMLKKSPQTQKNIFTVVDARTRNQVEEIMRQTQNSAFESESIQDTDEIMSFQRLPDSNRKVKIVDENSRMMTSTDLIIDNI
ncbi:UNKNOWN [Stylonychia lemnae]|uniref:Uncharacterized protein n=1 Tax=Stylonychia lemnae TaxID=5949 RepID=A0A078APS6_STYLE|nr:UNKNOWN [Stylonychia lemnae]|eukprot:CDW82923.1 UNKNOWN [Stylonychia lemnae]